MTSRRTLLRGFVAALVALCAAPALSQTSSSPAEPVRKLYATYGTGDSRAQGFSENDAATLLSTGLLAIYRRAAKAGMDADFFVQGQDFNLAKPIDITEVEMSGDRARIAATLTQTDADASGKPKQRVDRFIFTLVRESGVWKIDDALHGKDSARASWQATIRSGGVR